MTHFFKTYRLEILIFALALAARLLYFGVTLQVNDGDLLNTITGPDGYTTVSKNLIEGHGLTAAGPPSYEPYSFRPPLYHFFIAGSYFALGGYWGVILLQMLLGSLVPLLGMRVASYLIRGRALLAALGVFLALEPSGVLYSTFFYSETLFTVLFLAGVWTFFAYLREAGVSTRFLTASALLLGLATLTRPTTQFLPLIFAAVFMWTRRRELFSRQTVLPVVLYAAIFLAVLSPWLVRNYTLFGVAGLSPQTGVNLYTTLLPTVYSIDRGTTFQEEFAAQRAAGIPGPNEAVITDGAKDMALAVPLLLQHPRALLYSALNSTWSFFVLDGMYDFFRHINVRPSEVIGKPSVIALFSDPGAVVGYLYRNIAGVVGWIVLARLFWIAVAAAFVVGAWRYMRANAGIHGVLTLLIVAYFLLTSLITGFGLTARYRLPVNVFVVTFALCEVAAIAPWLMQKTRRLHA